MAVEFSFLSFNSMELTFCFSPNYLGCAAVEMALEQVQQLHIIDSISIFLGLPNDVSEKIQKAKKLLLECNAKKEDKKQFKTTRHFMKGFHEDTNKFFKPWMQLYYKHLD